MDEEIPYNELLVDVDDSIVVGLYHYLWLKDGKGRPCPEVNIPHTIIISNGRPKVWYFTSGKERCIKRKHRSNINNSTIMDALAPKPKGGDSAASSPEPSTSGGLLGTWGAPAPSPAAQRHEQSHHHNQQQQGTGRKARSAPGEGQRAPPLSPSAAATEARMPDGSSTGNALGPWPPHGVVCRFQGSMTNPQLAANSANAGKGASLGRRKKGAQFELQEESVEFFSREQLAEMLPPGHAVVHGVAALHEGVLQRFVQPRGQHHFSIRATWSPNACVVERRTSKAKLNDPRVPLADRLAGWDGPNWLSEHTLITGTVLQGSICRLCDNVAAHIADVSNGGVRVLRMVLFFMVDDANRIWLTHCGTLKTQRLPEMAYAMPLTSVGSGPVAMQLAARLRPGSMPPPLPAATASALRLRAMESANAHGGSGGGAAGGVSKSGGADPGLDLPAPSPVFMSSKAAAKAEGGDGDGDEAGTSGRFLCVLTGEMFPGSQRCEVTYKQLLQHWFSLASQLPNEGDRLRAMDTIPLAIRRANPSLTREWYLRVRSQPTFLYRTAPVCAEAAGQITGVALEELQRTMRPGFSGSGAPPSAAAAAGPGAVFGSPGHGLVSGSGARPSLLGGLETSPGALFAGLGRPSIGGGGAARPNTAAAGAALGRPRPATAAAGMVPQLPPPPGTPSQAAHAPRLAARQLGGASRGAVMRSKSASPSLAAARLPPSTSGGGGGGGGGMAEPSGLSVGAGGSGGGYRSGSVLPSMLLPRDKSSASAAAAAGHGGASWAAAAGASPLLQVYGPTAEQAADAAMAAAVLPYAVLDETQQTIDGAEADGAGTDDASGGAGDAGGVTSAAGSPRAAPSTAAGAGSGQKQSAEAAASSSAGQAPGSGEQAWAVNGPVHGNAVPTARPASRLHHMRMSASSEVTEIGSNASNSDPNSPNGTHTGLHPHAHVHGQGHSHAHLIAAGVAGGGGSGSSGGAAPARLSPPRSAGMLTLQTIHEEGAGPVPGPRQPSPLGPGGELAFPPPRSAGGSHSVPRMRPPTRSGTDRPPPAGSSFGNRGPNRYASGAPYGAVGSSGAFSRGLSESGDLPQLPHGGGGSLESTMASSMGSARSRRSTNTNAQQHPGMLSNDDLRTLRELSEAYTAAERLTQQLLAQANEILSEEGSRPGSTGTSPMHGGRRQVSPPMAVGGGAGGGGGSRQGARRTNSSTGLPMARQPSLTGGGAAAPPPPSGGGGSASGGGGGGSGPGSRVSSAGGRASGVPQLPAKRPGSGASLGSAAPVGPGSRQGSVRAGSAGSGDGNAISERSLQTAVQILPPVAARAPSGSGSLQLGPGSGDAGSVGGGGGEGGGSGGGSGGGAPPAGSASGVGVGIGAASSAGGAAPSDLGLLTSAEADLLAEALLE